jgi:hypothetical protein
MSIALIACKCENPPHLRQVDADFHDQIKSRFNSVEACVTSANVPESQKRCISIILRSILKHKKGKPNQFLQRHTPEWLYCPTSGLYLVPFPSSQLLASTSQSICSFSKQLHEGSYLLGCSVHVARSSVVDPQMSYDMHLYGMCFRPSNSKILQDIMLT